ncbi:PREDICTED: uncharacterized protein LOC108382671, partial [Rhagoletis zephyria]|uniref:uncharacterized protein LOC108382671 n=1 Tax=Rhagoletis zephyria TaxID=28612 RepID=UPI00081175F6
MKILRRKFDKKGTNCEDDEDLNLDWNIADEDSLKDNLGPSEQLAMDVDIPEEQFSWDIDIPEEHFALAEGASAEIQVQRYYAGYTIYQKLLSKSQCKTCIDAMVKTPGELKDYSEALIRAKNYKECPDVRLINPTEWVFEILRMQMAWYKHLFQKYAHSVGIHEQIVNALIKKTNEEFSEWFSEAGDCFEHRKQLLNSMVTVLLFKNARWLAGDEAQANM